MKSVIALSSRWGEGGATPPFTGVGGALPLPLYTPFGMNGGSCAVGRSGLVGISGAVGGSGAVERSGLVERSGVVEESGLVLESGPVA